MDDLKKAMHKRKESEVSVLRLLLAALKNLTIFLGKNIDGELTEEEVIQAVQSEIKKRNDSIEAYTAGSRFDLADKEKGEIEILKKYLPEQISDEEIEKIVRKIAETDSDASMQNFGQIMGQAMPRVKGKADGNKVSEIVKRVLSDQEKES